MTDETKATNVIEALARVVRDMPGIGKNDDSSQGYKYRGIEAITRETQGLLGKHGVVFVPEVLSWETDQLTVNNKPWTDTKLKVVYRVYGPGGVEDVITVGPICAIGRDNSDKGANKAMTQAFKYALLQTLCIGDAKDDGDEASHEADARQAFDNTARANELQDRIALLPEEAQTKILNWFKAPVAEWGTYSDEALDRLAEVIARAEEQTAPPEAAEQQGPTAGPGPTAEAPAAPAEPPLTAAERAAARGTKKALGAVKNAPVADEDVQAHFPGSEVVA